MRQSLIAPEQLAPSLMAALVLIVAGCSAPSPSAGTDPATPPPATTAVEPVSPTALAELEAEEAASGSEAADDAGGMDMDHADAGEDPAAGEPVDHSDPEHTHDTLAEPFAADTFGGSGQDYGAAFTPDGQTVFFTRSVGGAVGEAIYFARRVGDGWSEPEAAPFSGRFHDKEPYVAADGRRVYFASRRPVAGSSAREDLDLFYVERVDDGWGDAVHLTATSTSANEDYPAVAADGTVVFARTDDNNVDLWIAHAAGEGIATPRRFDGPINTVYAEADPWIAADGGTIVFSSPRIGPDAQGQGDLYVIQRRPDGWTPPRTLGFDVNTVAHEYGPVLSPDGRTFYFARGFGGELWQVPVTALANFAAH